MLEGERGRVQAQAGGGGEAPTAPPVQLVPQDGVPEVCHVQPQLVPPDQSGKGRGYMPTEWTNQTRCEDIMRDIGVICLTFPRP